MKLPPSWLYPRPRPAPDPDMIERLEQINASLRTIIAQGTHFMTTLADIKTQLDTLQSDEQKLEAFAVSSQTSLASIQAQLDAAKANSADPAALDAIAAEIAAMQKGVAAAIPAATVAPPAAA